MIAVYFRGLFRGEITNFKCRLGLPVVREVSGVVTMKSINMYILHDSSLVFCFSNICAYLALSQTGHVYAAVFAAGRFVSRRHYEYIASARRHG